MSQLLGTLRDLDRNRIVTESSSFEHNLIPVTNVTGFIATTHKAQARNATQFMNE